MTYQDMAVEILRATNDGNRLAPVDLSLIQSAVNGWLTECGETAFVDLFGRVQAGYEPPTFHGIDYLTIDHEGYVYWRGIRVEHYTPSWAYSAEAKGQALKLADICRNLEAQGTPVTGTAVWKAFGPLS